MRVARAAEQDAIQSQPKQKIQNQVLDLEQRCLTRGAEIQS